MADQTLRATVRSVKNSYVRFVQGEQENSAQIGWQVLRGNQFGIEFEGNPGWEPGDVVTVEVSAD